MFITDWRLDAIIKLDKITGDKEEILVRESQSNRLYGVKVYSKRDQSIDSSHPCHINNGGCQKLCFAIPTKTKYSDFAKKVQYYVTFLNTFICI